MTDSTEALESIAASLEALRGGFVKDGSPAYLGDVAEVAHSINGLVRAVGNMAAGQEEDLPALASAVRAIAHGPTSGPTGLELVSMSLATLGEPTVSAGLHAIAGAIADLADAVREGAS